MGHMPEEDTEWAVVHRWAMMLRDDRHPEFKVTHAYSLFTPILCWIMQRMRKGDGRGRKFQRFLQKTPASNAAWRIPLDDTALHAVSSSDEVAPENVSHWPVEAFLIALRNAVAHADERGVKPKNDGNALIGYCFSVAVVHRLPASDILVAERRGKASQTLTWKGDIVLREADMRRIGGELAEQFCWHMTGKNAEERRQTAKQLFERAA